MGYIWNDRTDVAIFSNGIGTEDSEICTTCKVTRTTNTIHHFATHNMSRVYIAKNIKFDSGIHGNDTNTTSNTRVIGDFLRTKNNFFTIFINIRIETFQSIWRRTQCSTGTYSYFTSIDQVKHTVLNYFCINR